ncbi:polyprenyl synthetase family protein [Nocardia panacis]|uniref:Polyprenyl synthetase family protein n=1 Tax=Nocardia panacis TaxID=2340916 RepID=A0A3A4KLD4_9NOCA|nr:polyprenyl synthetase family protein [Nocardia panacis]RJO75631.1 polyprenyl synthetase family protein [Nocardia panacis]
MTAVVSVSPTQPPTEILARTRKLVEPMLREAIAALPDPLRRMAGYHFGWWDVRGNPAPGESGKMLRPALTVSACLACGGVPEDAVPAAVAVELIHNFTLIHDDVMDGDTLRHARPTVWTIWGIPDAVLLGDALHAVAAELLVRAMPHGVGAQALQRLESAVIELCRGQHEDCHGQSGSGATIADCERMEMGKTGALMGCACALGALAAGAAPATVAALDRCGRELGLAFQFTDDLIGIWGDPLVSGKPTSDLARRKRSMPVVAALCSQTAQAAELARIYGGRDPMSPTDIARAAELIEEAGGRNWTQRQADRHIQAALCELPDARTAADLIALACLVTHRNR